MNPISMLMRSRWILALRGALALLLGLFALLMPGVTLLSLIAVFALYALLVGAVSIIGALRHSRNADDWWALLLLGIVSLLAGALAATHPALTALALVMVIGVNALVTGMLDIVLALRLRKAMPGAWLLTLSALVSIAFAVLILAYPDVGALALVWMIGVYALLTGALYLTLAYRAGALPARAGFTRPRVDRRTGERRMAR
ncbi:uncharacterized membrane protein HdeD (DUF308 family) [Oxalobacteraceae bacterium GrIS 1.11]